MSEDSFFHEVEEELRSDRMRNLWRKYGVYIIGAAVAVVLIVAASEGWRWWHDTNSAKSADLLYSALDLAQKGDVAGAEKALATVQNDGVGGYPMLAKFRDAQLLLSQGKIADAVADYDALSSQAGDRRLRELALVLGAYALVDKGDVNAVKTRVDGIIASGSPLANSAREALGLAQYKAGKLKQARTTFESVATDPNGSRDQIARIALYLGQLTAEGVGPTPKADTDKDAASTDKAAPGGTAEGAKTEGAKTEAPAAGDSGAATAPAAGN